MNPDFESHPSVLCAQGLTKRYGSLLAVDDLSLTVNEGEIFGFLGPNGAGKTTSIRMLTGLLKPDAGQVYVRGHPLLDGNRDTFARVGLCPQEIVIWERLTCLEQLQFTGEMYGLKAAEARRRSLGLLETLDLAAKRNQQARFLSGGMKRRLNLLLALVHDPEIIVLDEPEAGLDPQSRLLVRGFLRSLARRKTIILTTQNMDEAERVADRVAIIDHGRLLVVDTPEGLKRSLGEGEVVDISVDGSPERLADFASSLSPEMKLGHTPDGAVLRVPVNLAGSQNLSGFENLTGLFEKIEQAGLRRGDVRLRASTLEDVFIHLTGRRLRE